MLFRAGEKRVREGIRLNSKSSVGQIFSEGRSETYAWPSIRGVICLDPDDILAPPVSPLCENFAPTFEAFTCTAADPEEDKARVCREGRNGKILQVLPGE